MTFFDYCHRNPWWAFTTDGGTTTNSPMVRLALRAKESAKHAGE